MRPSDACTWLSFSIIPAFHKQVVRMGWKPSSVKRGVAIYTYEARRPHELSLDIGDVVLIIEEYDDLGWYRGHPLRNKDDIGIFPASFVHVRQFSGGVGNQPCDNGINEPVVEEMADCLHVWGDMLKTAYVNRKEYDVQRLNRFMGLLVKWRRDILHSSLPSDQLLKLKLKTAAAIDKCNVQMGLDVVPRNEAFEPVDVDNTSILDLYHSHTRVHTSHSTPFGVSARSIHIHSQVMSLSCHVPGEETDFLFSLYDASKQQFISERVSVRSSADGNVESLWPNRRIVLDWLFTDLDRSFLSQLESMFIVCHVVRLGRMDLSVKKHAVLSVRRPVGCVVLPLARLDAVVDDPGTGLRVSNYMHPVTDEKDFSTLHDAIIQGRVRPNERAGSVCLALQLVYGELREALETQQEILNKDTTIVRKIGCTAFTLPGEERNDIFITIHSGEFEKGGKSAAKNVEVTAKLLDMNGMSLEMITQTATSPPTSEVHSIVFYHNNSPQWNEPIRLNVPLDRISNAILAFYIRHSSTSSESRTFDKQSAFAYIKLLKKDGETLSNGLVDLCVYRYTADCVNPGKFLTAASTPADMASGPISTSLILSRKESFCVKVDVCSTKLTQDHRLAALLHWHEHADLLEEVLEGVRDLSGRDACVFMQDSLDALFNILQAGDKAVSQAVLGALVHFLSFLRDSRYEQFVETFDTYVYSQFSGGKAYNKILHNICVYLDNANQPRIHERLMEIINVLPFLLKIIIQSYRLDTLSTNISCSDTTLKEALAKLIESVNTMLQQSVTSLQPMQEAVLKRIGQSIDILHTAFTSMELGGVLASCINAISLDVLDSFSVKSRLDFMVVLTNDELFLMPAVRQNLLATILTHCQKFLSSKTHENEVLNVLGRVVSRLESKACAAGYDDKYQLSLFLPHLVPRVASLALGVDASPAKSAFLCSLLGILRLMNSSMYGELLETLPDWVSFVRQLFIIFRYVLTANMFDKSWTSIRIIQCHVIFVSLSHLSQVLQKDVEQNIDLLKMYFSLASHVITQPFLQLESLHTLKAFQLEARFGDIRYAMASEVVMMWSILGNCQRHFVPTLVKPFLRAAIVKHADTRRAILPVFIDMLNAEYEQSSSVKAVSGELISVLDTLINKGCGDYKFLTLLAEIWRQKVTSGSITNDHLRSQINSLIERFVNLGSLLIDYRSLGMEDETSSDRRSRMLVLYNTAMFYREHGPPKLYYACLYKLAQLHIAESSWTEAAFTLMRLSDSLVFHGKTVMDAISHYPQQTASARKEALLQEMVKYFGLGKAFECGIEQCDYLIAWYRHQVFDFTKLRLVLEVQAMYFGGVVADLRPAREYFRVGFYGHGFPYFLRNKVFVYRGEEYEKLTSFQDRIQEDHENVELMKTNQLPGEEVTSSNNRYLQICTVKPCGVIMELLESADVNERIRDYYRVNNVTRFEYSRPYHQGPKDKDNEFKTLWLERTTIHIAWPLPGILQCSEVIHTEVHLVSSACLCLYFACGA